MDINGTIEIEYISLYCTFSFMKITTTEDKIIDFKFKGLFNKLRSFLTIEQTFIMISNAKTGIKHSTLLDK